MGYATALHQAGLLADAEPAYRTALALNPATPPPPRSTRGYSPAAGAPREALSLLTPPGQQRPDDPQIVLLLGLARRRADEPAATEATLRHFLDLAPESPQAGVLGETP